ncbi:MAG TPA: magnesium/cobalt transporter CorA [Anaerolineaceae bacterium]
MISSFLFPAEGLPIKDIPTTEYLDVLKKPDNLLWVILDKPDPGETEYILNQIFHFHPLAIEDCLSIGYQPPKIDIFRDYLFLILHAISPNGDYSELVTMELNIFLGQNYLVTCHMDDTMPPIETVKKIIERDDRLWHNGSDFLCHAIIDALVDDYMPILDQMDEEIEWLENQVLEKPNPHVLERILQLKHSIMTLRRITSPQREIINHLTYGGNKLISPESQVYFRDIYDHLVRIYDLSESIRDIVSGSMDIYLNSTSLRLNEVMRALTIVSTIFLPLSFIAGVYGMNFLDMPELHWGYPWIWIIFFLCGFGMLYFFKRRNWF